MIKSSNKFKAFGLVEVLVGLAITGGILITITSVAVTAYRQVKNNELSDFANGSMTLGIEYFKTPITDPLTEPAKTLSEMLDGTYVFKVSSNIDDSENFQIMPGPNNEASALTDCVENDDYQVKFANASNGFLLCNKIVVVKTNNSFNITSYIAYQTLNNEIRTSKLIGFRQKI